MTFTDEQIRAALFAFYSEAHDIAGMRAALEAAAQAAPATDLRPALELAWSHCDPFQVPDADIAIIKAALGDAAQRLLAEIQ